jgi:predicted AAA+ superfamily ATPase
MILRGPSAVADWLELGKLCEAPPVVVFDELHKYPKWKAFLKGFFDTWERKVRIIVTGSSRLDVFRRGGDSLMGRYFLYRMHPWSVAECLTTELPGEALVRFPREIDADTWRALREHGGYPEPFLKRNPRFTRRWRELRRHQLMREDVRDTARIEDLGTLETLGEILAERSGAQLVYSGLARETGASVDSIRRWVDLLVRLHYGFLVRPWFRNVTRSLRKEPKWYLRDWSGVPDPGARAETFAACHLLKAVEGWSDLGFGSFELRYLRDKEKREVDFLVVRNRQPWFLVEVKQSESRLSRNLAHFQAQTGAAHAFQAVASLPFVGADCFAESSPVVVPMRTLFSQLL